MKELEKIINEQKIFLRTGLTNTEDFRKKALITLKTLWQKIQKIEMFIWKELNVLMNMKSKTMLTFMI